MHDQILTGTIGIFLAIHGVAAPSASACVLRDTAPPSEIGRGGCDPGPGIGNGLLLVICFWLYLSSWSSVIDLNCYAGRLKD